MKNPVIYYGIIALGVIALVAGVVLLVTATKAAPHHLSSYAALGVGVVLLIGGIAGMIVAKPKAAAK
jgi:uncharacterized membrane protein HdeD (DUF308 family)